MAALDAQRDKLMKEAEEAQKVVQKAEEEQKKAEREATEAQAKLKDQGDRIDAQAQLVQTEIVEKKLTNEQLEEGMSEIIQEKYEREEREYQEWERQQTIKTEAKTKDKLAQFDKTIRPKLDALKESAQVEFKKGSYSEAIAFYKKGEELLEIARDDFQNDLKKELALAEAAIFGNLALCYSKE